MLRVSQAILAMFLVFQELASMENQTCSMAKLRGYSLLFVFSISFLRCVGVRINSARIS